MVNDDGLDARLGQNAQALCITGATIAGHQQRWPLPLNSRDCSGRYAISPFKPIGELYGHASAERSERMGHNCRGSNSVTVVVAEDADPFTFSNCLNDAVRSRASVGHRVRRRQVREPGLEKIARRSWLMQPLVHQKSCCRVRNAHRGGKFRDLSENPGVSNATKTL